MDNFFLTFTQKKSFKISGRATSNKQKVSNKEENLTNMEQKVTSNELKLTRNEQKLTGNEQPGKRFTLVQRLADKHKIYWA